jgi:glucoamylase
LEGKALFVAFCLVGGISQAEPFSSDLDAWIASERPIALQKLKASISPPGSAKGAVVASPDSIYYFHWVRDAALSLDALQREVPASTTLFDFARFSRLNQLTETRSGDRSLGEPKFFVDGSAYWGDWGRPQDDSPASRALTLIRFARSLLSQNRIEEVRQLYDGKLPTSSVIKADLEYVSKHWRETSFDLWEEVRGLHFYTQMVQRRSLIEGAALARQLGDDGAADWYARQSREMESSISEFWNGNLKVIVPTRHRDAGIDYKNSGLDSAVVLGVLHALGTDRFFSPSDPRVVATIEAIEKSFQSLYPINRNKKADGIAIGRYPEDRYVGGNPWFLTTAALAEYYYRRGLKERGDAYLSRIRFHADPDGSLSEQFDKFSGKMTSVNDLTWSYAAFLTAVQARSQLQRHSFKQTFRNRSDDPHDRLP